MLKDLRKHSKSWLIKALFVIIIITFISWGGYRKASSWGKDYIAKVDGEKIKRDEFEFIVYHRVAAMREQYKKYLKRDLEESEVNNIREMILNQLIESKIIHSLSEKSGIPVSKKEIADSIKNEEVFQNPDSHEFDFDRYKNFLKYYRKTPSVYEEERKEELKSEKLRNLVMNFSKISDNELKEIFNLENTKINLEFFAFDSKEYKKGIKVKIEDVEKHFNDNKEKYKTEEKRKIEYIEVDPNELYSGITPKEDEIKNLFEKEYKNSKDNLKGEKRHIRIISLREKEGESRVKEANTIKELAKNSKTFVSLAKEYSDDFTKKDGGDLGYVEKSDLTRFGEFGNSLFKLKAGDVAGPIKDKNNYYIGRVEDILPAGDISLERLKNYIQHEIKKKKSKELADETASKLREDIKSEKDLSKLSQKYSLPVKKSDYFKKSGELPSIVEPYLVQNESFQLSLSETKDVKTSSGISYFIKLVEINEPHVPDLAEAYSDVENDLVDQKSRELAKSDSEKFFNLVKSREDLYKQAPSFSAKILESGEFTLSESFNIPKIGKNEELAKESFNLGEQSPVAKKVYEVDGKFIIPVFKSRINADMAKFSEKRDELIQKLNNERNDNIFTTWKDFVSKEVEIKKYN